MNAALEKLIEQQRQTNISITAIDRNNQLLDQLAEAAGLNSTQDTRVSQPMTKTENIGVMDSIDLDPGILSPIAISSITTAPNKTMQAAQGTVDPSPPSTVTQDKGFITVFNGKDGTLRLTPETAKALGIDAHLRPPPQNNIIFQSSVNQSQNTIASTGCAKITQPHQGQLQLQTSPNLSNSMHLQKNPAATTMTMAFSTPSIASTSSFNLNSQIYSGLKVSTTRGTRSDPCFLSALHHESQSVEGNNLSHHQENLMGKAVTLNLPTTTQAQKMILIPTTEPDGTVTYLLRPPSLAVAISSSNVATLTNRVTQSSGPIIQTQAANQPTIQIVNTGNHLGNNLGNQQFIQLASNHQPSIVSLSITKPTVIGNRIHVPIRTSQNHSAVLTNVMRPIMTTGVAHTSLHRHHPAILPKPPSKQSTLGAFSTHTTPICNNASLPKNKIQYKKKKQLPTSKKSGTISTTSRVQERHQEESTREAPKNSPSDLMKTPSRLFVSSQQQHSHAPYSLSQDLNDQSNLKPNIQSNDVNAHFVIVDTPNSVDLSESSKTFKGPFGTFENPIHIVPEGNTFRSLQPITNTQITSIAKVLKDTRPDFGDRKITYRDKERNIEYKIIYPDEALANLAQAANKNMDEENEDFEDDDSDDEDEEESLARLREPIYLSPEELLMGAHPFFSKSDARGPIRRKRGRPSAIERFSMMFRKPGKESAKRLRKEFGFSEKTANALQKDIVDDQNITQSLFHSSTIGSEDNEEKIMFSSSRTRSGRVTRPPIQIDQEFKTSTSVSTQNDLNKEALVNIPLKNNLESVPYVEKEQAPPKEQQPSQKVKRSFTVPPRYRCRVCHKMYLGDRKMNRHIKNYPGHGPIFEPPLPPPPPPRMSDEIAHKMPTPLSSVPIIPLARNQLEDLVKNLDAELVLDVVAKKMFDNFSMWDLQMKKASLSNAKGLNVLEKLFSDTEKVLGELKKLVDNCLTDTKLSDKPCPSIHMGEYVQLALSGHDSPWYLEQSNHVPTEYHSFFGIEPAVMSSMVSPRSESSNPGPVHQIMQVNPPEMDDNTSSLISGTSDKDGGPSNSGQEGMGAQMVLEQNLGVANRSLDDIEDDDTQDGTEDDVPSSSSKKHHDSGSQDDFLNTQDESAKLMSPTSNPMSDDETETLNEKEDSAIVQSSNENIRHKMEATNCNNDNEGGNEMNEDNDDEEEDMEEDEVDPKQVLEQNGIDITCEGTHKEQTSFGKTSNIPSNDLAMEIDSLVPTLTSGEDDSGRNYPTKPITRLPSFSSIIAGSPKTSTRTSTDSTSENILDSAQPNTLECMTTVGSILSAAHDSIANSPCVSDHNPGSVASVLSRHDEADVLHHPVAAALASNEGVMADNEDHLSIISDTHPVLTTHSRRSSIAHSDHAPMSSNSRRSSIEHAVVIGHGGVATTFMDPTRDVSGTISSRRSSFDHNSIHSGPPSVDIDQQNQIHVTNVVSSEVPLASNIALGELPHSGPPSVDLNLCSAHHPPQQQVGFQKQLLHTSTQCHTQPSSADDLLLHHFSRSGPPSVDVRNFQCLDQQNRTENTSTAGVLTIQESVFSTGSSLAPMMQADSPSPSISTNQGSMLSTQRHIQSMPNSPLSSSNRHDSNAQLKTMSSTNDMSQICRSQPSSVMSEPLNLLSSLVDNTSKVGSNLHHVQALQDTIDTIYL